MITLAALALAPALHSTPAVTVTLVKKVPGVHPIAFAAAPSGPLVAVSMENNEIRIINTTTRQTVRTLTGHPQPAYAVAWSKDGTMIATGDESARIFIWSAKTGAKLRTIIGHTKGIQALSFNGSRTMLASTGKDDAVNVWDLDNGKKVAQILGKGMNLYSATFHPKLNTLLVGTLSGGARTYRITGSGAQVMNFLVFNNPTGQPHGVFDCEWSPDGTRAITAANDGMAAIWDMKTFKKVGTLKGHADWIMRADLSPNGKLAATGSADRTVKVWDTKTMKEVTTLENEGAVGSPVCFTADGKYLLTTGIDDNLEFYSLKPTQSASGKRGHEDEEE